MACGGKSAGRPRNNTPEPVQSWHHQSRQGRRSQGAPGHATGPDNRCICQEPRRVTRPARAISSHTLKPFMELLGESRPVDAVDDGPGRLVAPVLRVRDIPVPRRHAFWKQRSTAQIHLSDFFQP